MSAAFEVPWHVGDEIRIARTHAGLEQSELAQKIGVSRPTISNWETGKSEPTISQFRAIAELTDAPWLLRQNLKKMNFALVGSLLGQMEIPFGDPVALEVVERA